MPQVVKREAPDRARLFGSVTDFPLSVCPSRNASCSYPAGFLFDPGRGPGLAFGRVRWISATAILARRIKAAIRRRKARVSAVWKPPFTALRLPLGAPPLGLYVPDFGVVFILCHTITACRASGGRDLAASARREHRRPNRRPRRPPQPAGWWHPPTSSDRPAGWPGPSSGRQPRAC